MSLTDKQAAFVREYPKDLNATQAAIRAGYSENTAGQTASRLFKNVKILAAIEDTLADRSERVQVDADYVLNNLVEIVERCMERAPVMVRRGRHMVQLVDDEGRDVWQFDSRGATKAIELLGKHLAMWTNRLDVSGRVVVENAQPQDRESAIIELLRSRGMN